MGPPHAAGCDVQSWALVTSVLPPEANKVAHMISQMCLTLCAPFAWDRCRSHLRRDLVSVKVKRRGRERRSGKWRFVKRDRSQTSSMMGNKRSDRIEYLKHIEMKEYLVENRSTNR